MSDKIDKTEQNLLIKLAKDALAAELDNRSLPSPAIAGQDRLQEKRGVFVTWKKAGRLAGCLGHLIGRQALWQAVRELSVAAALNDPRFKPVSIGELPRLEVEISVLSPLRKVGRAEALGAIKVGRHGILITKARRQGVLLPQVATDYNWDAATFLRQSCRKAGLPDSAWTEPDTIIEVFEAQVFGR